MTTTHPPLDPELAAELAAVLTVVHEHRRQQPLAPIASLVISNPVAPVEADTIIANAVALFTGSGQLGRSQGSSDRR